MAETTAATTTATTTAATTTAATTTAAPWYQGVEGVDSEMVGHWTNSGWINKDPKEIAVQATKSWKAAERHVGVPADQLIRLPKDAADETAINAMWTKLGRPADPKGYDFKDIKFSDGTELEEGLTSAVAAAAFKLHVPKDMVAGLTREFVKYLDSAETTEKTEATAKLAVEKAELAKNWGPNFEPNKFVATRAAAALGFPPETVAALEGLVGYAKVMEMFRVIGTKIGEDKYVTGTAASGNGVMTRDQATARIAELKADKAFVNKYLAGDAAAKREMEALHRIITPVAA